MALEPAITNLEQLQGHPEIARLLAWDRAAIEAAKFDRGQLAVYLARGRLRESCAILRDDPELQFRFLSDVTCVDWYPMEPRFEVVYELLSMKQKRHLRLKVRLAGGDARVDSLTPLWPAANFFEREVFDLFGIHFEGHPYLRRIMMPENWEGHPLRKDYPVEGYR